MVQERRIRSYVVIEKLIVSALRATLWDIIIYSPYELIEKFLNFALESWNLQDSCIWVVVQILCKQIWKIIISLEVIVKKLSKMVKKTCFLLITQQVFDRMKKWLHICYQEAKPKRMMYILSKSKRWNFFQNWSLRPSEKKCEKLIWLRLAWNLICL
jgi:hypothetical protein